jgi:hypothetical protein
MVSPTSEPAHVTTSPQAPPRPPADLKLPTWAADFMAAASSGWGGSAGGLGGGVGGRRFWASGIGLRLGGAVLTGELNSGDLRLWSARVSMGVSVGRAISRSFVLGARLDGLGVWETVAQTESGARDRQGRWLPGAAALIEAAWKIGQRVYLVGDAGSEALFGKTSIFLDDRAVATLPAWRFTAELGVRLGF